MYTLGHGPQPFLEISTDVMKYEKECREFSPAENDTRVSLKHQQNTRTARAIMINIKRHDERTQYIL